MSPEPRGAVDEWMKQEVYSSYVGLSMSPTSETPGVD
jgi:hypothetical protein